MIDALAASPVGRAVGLALLDFLWQGAAIGCATWLVLIGARRATAQVRYAVACLGLLAMAAAPIVTSGQYLRALPASARRGVLLNVSAQSMNALPGDAGLIAVLSSTAEPGGGWTAWLEPRLPFVVLIWSLGVVLLGLYLLHGWVRVRRIRRTASLHATSSLWEMLARVAARLSVSRPVQLIESTLVEVPAVIGWLRPAIVLPASAFAGLSPAHLEAILAHELAHVRRGDYLVNLAQCVVEVLLFYHPAVWWTSRQIRLEREHCCDDVAAACCANRAVYARALTRLEELRGPAPALALGAGGGDLLGRIRRLLDPGFAPGPRLSGGLAMSVVLIVLFVAASGHVSSTSAADDRPGVADGESHLPPPAMTPAVAGTREARQTPPVKPVAAPPRDAQVVAVPKVDPIGRGTIAGDVRDGQGGVVPGARVTLTSPATPAPTTLTTDVRGQFQFTDLASGTYELTVALSGFRTSRLTMHVTPNERVTARVLLELGGLSETVTVRAVSPQPSASLAGPMPTNLQTASDFFDAAKWYYQQARLADAEAMTTRAQELLRLEQPERPAAPPPADPTGVVRVGGSITEPRKLRHVAPIYPAAAQSAGVDGVVILEAIIAKNGSVQDVKVLRSVPLLDEAAIGAVRQWLFSPTLLDKVPVEVIMTVTVNFTR